MLRRYVAILLAVLGLVMVVASGCTILTEIPHQTENPSGEAGGTTQGSHTEAT